MMKQALIALIIALTLPTTVIAGNRDNIPSDSTGQSVEALYDIYWKGIKVFTAEFQLTLQNTYYQIGISSRTRGPLRLLVKGQNHAMSEGQIEEGNFGPSRFLSFGKWGDDLYMRQIEWNGETPPDIKISMPDDWTRREAVPEEMKKNTDPLSLLLHMIQDPYNLVQNPESNIEFEGFDGLSAYRYDLICEGERETLSTGRDVPYEGPVLVCSLGTEQIAGFRIPDEDEEERNEDVEDELEDRRLIFWLAKSDSHGLYIPVRLDAESRRGSVRAYLKEINIPVSSPFENTRAAMD